MDLTDGVKPIISYVMYPIKKRSLLEQWAKNINMIKRLHGKH